MEKNIFEKIRDWSDIRGMQNGDPQMQYQRLLQEVVEIHDALVKNDRIELIDAIGDVVIALTNFAKTVNLKTEGCIDKAFNVIEKRKGITTPKGDFVRYGKLGSYEKNWCDEHQGNPGCEYFIDTPKPEDFKLRS